MLPADVTFMWPNQGTVLSELVTVKKEVQQPNDWKREPFYLILQKIAKELVQKWESSGRLKMVAVRSVPESEKQLAPGSAAFQTCWRWKG